MTSIIRILGIDPGLSRCGYAVIDYNGRFPVPVEFGHITTKPKEQTAVRLKEITDSFRDIISQFSPAELAIERVYFHRNVSTAIDVAMVMGSLIVLAMDNEIECRQYAPRQIKRAIVGTGSADKNQVMEMVKTLYNLEIIPKPPDVADALAVALTHAHLRNSVEEFAVG